MANSLIKVQYNPANNFDTGADLTTYTSSNPYTFPNDGYISIGGNGNTGFIYFKLEGSDGNSVNTPQLYVIGVGSDLWNIQSIPVKRGMKGFVVAKSGTNTALYYKLK